MSAVEDYVQTEVVSPFLEGTKLQYAWDSTSLGYLKGCPRLYYYTMIEGWQPRGESIHLRFGIEYHQALQDYDLWRASGADHDEALRNVVKDLLIRTIDFHPSEEQYGSAAKYKSRENLLRTVVWYLEKYPKEKDPAETYIMEDGKPAVELSFKLELDWGPSHNYYPQPGSPEFDGAEAYNAHLNSLDPQPFILAGHLDRVVKYQGDLFWMDRKTTKSQPGDFYFTQYNPDNQMTLYTIAAQVILQSPVKGGMIDAAQVGVDFSRFQRGFTFRSQDQIDEWLLDLKVKLKENESYVEADHWPMNDRYCGAYRSEETGQIGCPFREVCQKTPRMREPFLRSKFNKLAPEERWNPLKPR